MYQILIADHICPVHQQKRPNRETNEGNKSPVDFLSDLHNIHELAVKKNYNMVFD